MAAFDMEWEQLEVLEEAVLQLPQALGAVAEFCASFRLPTGIDWFEL